MNPEDRIRHLRDKRGLSALELAAQLGVTRESIYLWERGLRFPKRGVLLALLRAFGVTEGQFWADDFPANLERKRRAA